MFLLSLAVPVTHFILLPILLLTGLTLIILIGESTKVYEYIEIKDILFSRISFLKKIYMKENIFVTQSALPPLGGIHTLFRRDLEKQMAYK